MALLLIAIVYVVIRLIIDAIPPKHTYGNLEQLRKDHEAGMSYKETSKRLKQGVYDRK